MDSIEVSFRAMLLTMPTLQQTFGERFHWNKIPDAPVYPLILATIVSDVPTYGHYGSGIGRAVIQLDVWHVDDLGCANASQTLKEALDGYTGAMGSYRTRMLWARNAPSVWQPASRNFRKLMELEIGYAY